MARRPAPSLKARALQWLAQREHSRLELRRKLLRHARIRDAARDAVPKVALEAGLGAAAESALQPEVEERSAATVRAEAAAEVDALLDWLQAERHLSDARFVESRVNARAARYGNRRIQQELKQHGTALDDAGRAQLKASEMQRARTLFQRRFGKLSSLDGDVGASARADAAARAKQMRFLAARGFSADVIHQVLRGAFEDEETPA